MRLRFRLHLAALTLLCAGAAACTDESPLLSGEPFFPDGRPVTLEAVIPASAFLTLGGSFGGYTDAQDAPYAVVANTFDGGVSARTLVRFPGAFPQRLEYSQDNTARPDSLYTVVSVELVLSVDSSASVSTIMPFTVHRLGAAWDDSVVTWQVRSRDSTGVHNWSTPGGDFGPAVGGGSYHPGDSASVAVLPLNASEYEPLRRDSTHPGLIILASQPNTRLELINASLRVKVKPSNAVRDTTISLPDVAVQSANLGFIYDAEAPPAGGRLAAGTVGSTRTLFSMQIPDSVEVCAPACTRRPLRELALHHASLLLRPRLAGGGYRQLDSAVVFMRTVAEPELGRLAPLGDLVVSGVGVTGSPIPSRAVFAPTDTVVELPITAHVARLIAGDTVPRDFALLGAAPYSASVSPFSLLLFDAEPRLRIVFTVPERPRLP